MKNYKKVFKIFLAGQEDKETEWLSQMSKEGYHLVNVSFAIYYTFKKGKPQNYTYIIDMKGSSHNNDEYKLMHEDVGLEYIDNSNGYYYFRGNSDIETSNIIKNEQGRYLDRLNSQSKVILFASLINIVAILVYIHEFDMILYLNLGVSIICLLAYFNVKKKIKIMKNEGIKTPYKSTIKDWDTFWAVTVICAVCIITFGISIMIHHFI